MDENPYESPQSNTEPRPQSATTIDDKLRWSMTKMGGFIVAFGVYQLFKHGPPPRFSLWVIPSGIIAFGATMLLVAQVDAFQPWRKTINAVIGWSVLVAFGAALVWDISTGQGILSWLLGRNR